MFPSLLPGTWLLVVTLDGEERHAEDVVLAPGADETREVTLR